MIHIHNGYYSAIKKNETMPFATIWIEPEITILSKSQKDNYHILFICEI